MVNHSGLQILEIEITTYCNLKCKHCYVNSKNPQTMDEKLIFRLIDEADKLEPHDLIFTGGEPLLVKELLFKVAKYAKKKSFKRVGLLTNGLLINKNLAKELKIFDIIQLSIDNVNPTKEDYRPDYFDKLDKAIKILKKEKIPLKVQCTINKENIKNLPDILEYARKRDLPIGFNRTSPVGAACKLDRDIILTKEELKSALSWINKSFDPLSVKCSDPLMVLVNDEKKKFVLRSNKSICGGCIAGIAGCYVAVNGDVYACALLRLAVDNVNKKSLFEIWEKNTIFNGLRNRNNLIGKCKTCKFRSGCGGCRATAYGVTGNMFESDPFCWL